MKTLRKIFFSAFFAAVSVPAIFAAEKTVAARGEYLLAIDADVSPLGAMARAYDDAKEDALQRSFGMKVQTWDMLAREDVSGTSFTSLSLQSSQGIIKKFDVRKSGWRFEHPSDPASALIVYCEADVTVEQSDVKPDAEFFAKLDGGRLRYYEGEKASFSVTPSKDSNLTIFYLNARLGGSKVFPNRAFKKNRFAAGEKAQLRPISMLREMSGDEPERGWLMFVFTKKDIPFLEPPDQLIGADEINAWLARIPADERFFILAPYTILKENF